MAAIAADARSQKYASEAADAARMLRHLMRPALPMALSANPCFRSLLASDESVIWDRHHSMRLAESLRPFVPAGYEQIFADEGCRPEAESTSGVIMRGGVLRGDHPLKRKAFVIPFGGLGC